MTRPTLIGGGWQGPIGWCRGWFDVTHPLHFMTEAGEVVWEKVQTDRLVLSPVVAMLVLQGLPLQNLFPPDVHFELAGRTLSHGPYLFLAGELLHLVSAPCLLGVVLARVHRVPEVLSRERLLGLLLEQVRAG